jgi:hypothetical protein
MKKHFYFIIGILWLSVISCSNDHSKILPESSGKTHNILLIMENDDWKGDLGDVIRKYFAVEFSDLPQSEPLFSLQQAAPHLFSGIFKTYRDVLIIKEGDETGVKFYKNKYAEPQLIVVVEGKNKDEIKKLIEKDAGEIISEFRKFEIENLQRRHRSSLRNSKDIEEELGIEIEIPDFFALVDHQKNFFWFRRDLKNGEQDILLYSVPLKDKRDEKGERVIFYRDSIGKKYIPGPLDNTYMKTEKNISPSQIMTLIDHKKAIETRGLWNMKNDYMGGPYLNYSIIDKKNKRMIVGEGFIYAPAIDKRDYMVQLEAILKTIKLKK